MQFELHPLNTGSGVQAVASPLSGGRQRNEHLGGRVADGDRSHCQVLAFWVTEGREVFEFGKLQRPCFGVE